MPFGTITVNAVSYAPRDTGVYSKSTLTFGDPANEFRIKGATQGKDKSFRGSILRLLEKNVTEGSISVKKQALVALSITAPVGFTSAEIDGLASDISEFLTTDTITRLLAGES